MRIAARIYAKVNGLRREHADTKGRRRRYTTSQHWWSEANADRLDGKPAQESTVAVSSKRDASDWSRDELVAFLNDHRAGSNEPN